MQNLILALVPASLPLEAAYSSLGGTDGPDLSRYFLVCGILLAVIAAVAFGLRKLIAGSCKTRAAQRTLHVIDVMSLGGRQKVAVVRCYDRTFVLGLGEKEISPIAELDPVIGASVKAQAPRKSDEEAFAMALGKIQESMPRKQMVTELLEAQDRVSPGLAKKMEQARDSQDPAQVKEQTIPPAIESQSAQKRRVQKKRVRRKVAKKAQPSQSPRQLEAQAVASAALDLVASKRQARSQTPAVSTPKAQPGAPTPTTGNDANAEPPILRLEGILG